MGEHEYQDWDASLVEIGALIENMNKAVTTFVSGVSEALGSFISDDIDDDYDGPMHEFDEEEYLAEIALPPTLW